MIGIDHFPKIKLAEMMSNKGFLVGGSYLIHSSLKKSGYDMLSLLIDEYRLVCSDDYARSFLSRKYSKIDKNDEEIEIKKAIPSNKLSRIQKVIVNSMIAREWNDESGFGTLLDNVDTYLFQAIQIINNSEPNILFFSDIPHDPWEIALAEYAKLKGLKVFCPVHSGLRDVFFISQYPNFGKPLKGLSIEISSHVKNEVNKFLRDFNAQVNVSTNNFNWGNQGFVNLVIILPMILIYKNIKFYFETNFNNYHGNWRKLNSAPRRTQSRPYWLRLISKICRSLFHLLQLSRYQYKGFRSYKKNLKSKRKKIVALLQTRPEATQFPLSPYPNMYLKLNSEARNIQTYTGFELYFREHPNMFKPGKLFCSKDISNDEYNNNILPVGVSLTELLRPGDICLVNTSTAGIEQSRRDITVISICSPWWLGLPNTCSIDAFKGKSRDKNIGVSWNETYIKKSEAFVHLPWFHVDSKNVGDPVGANNLSSEQEKALSDFVTVLEGLA